MCSRALAPPLSGLLISMPHSLPLDLFCISSPYSLPESLFPCDFLLWDRLCNSWICRWDISILRSLNYSPWSFSYRRVPTPLEGYRGPTKFTREQQNNPFHQRLLCHGRPSLAIYTACWLPLLSSWGLNSWLWPEIVKLNVRLGPGSKIQHKYHGLPRYFNLAFNISCKVNISYVNMCTL